jgi:hypothetical protein
LLGTLSEANGLTQQVIAHLWNFLYVARMLNPGPKLVNILNVFGTWEEFAKINIPTNTLIISLFTKYLLIPHIIF